MPNNEYFQDTIHVYDRHKKEEVKFYSDYKYI